MWCCANRPNTWMHPTEVLSAAKLLRSGGRLTCSPILDRLAGADPAFRRQGGPCATGADSSDIGGLLPIALCGRTSL